MELGFSLVLGLGLELGLVLGLVLGLFVTAPSSGRKASGRHICLPAAGRLCPTIKITGLERCYRRYRRLGTLEDDRTVLYKTKSLDGTKLNTNHKTNPKTNPNHNTNHIQLFCAFFRAPSHDLQTSRRLISVYI